MTLYVYYSFCLINYLMSVTVSFNDNFLHDVNVKYIDEGIIRRIIILHRTNGVDKNSSLTAVNAVKSRCHLKLTSPLNNFSWSTSISASISLPTQLLEVVAPHRLINSAESPFGGSDIIFGIIVIRKF
ncbi:hypothetical protein EVAR_7464_1 [Eumeta japonica]|uniref:Uncharacterized protein n=1 Tax=Eumeta variegata TaxID=151549 RepID=A0A4C2A3A4_EUMVA|nr:hypothetical protein EVAR_7464_1 [Eumeta japonica]